MSSLTPKTKFDLDKEDAEASGAAALHGLTGDSTRWPLVQEALRAWRLLRGRRRELRLLLTEAKKRKTQPAGHACLLYAPMTTQSDSLLSSVPYKSSPPSLPPSAVLHQTFPSVPPELCQDLGGCSSTGTQKRLQKQLQRGWRVEGGCRWNYFESFLSCCLRLTPPTLLPSLSPHRVGATTDRDLRARTSSFPGRCHGWQ